MSAEIAETPAKAKRSKKEKRKTKDDPDPSTTKKRKRDLKDEAAPEEPEQQALPHSQEAKKTKKHKTEHTPNPTTTTTHSTTPPPTSPFHLQTTSLYLPLSPCGSSTPLQSLIAEHISPLLLTYYPPLHGVVLSHHNARLSEHPSSAHHDETSLRVLARSVNEYAASYVWLTADFVIFRPQRGTRCEGVVTVQNQSLLGLLCWNYFNAVVERGKLPEGWRWVDSGEKEDDEEEAWKKGREGAAGVGYFVDGEGSKVEGRIVFDVEDFEASVAPDTGTGTISIFGTMLGVDQER